MSVFVFFNVPTTGHVDPTLPVAAELVRRGHQVVYYLTENYRERIDSTGATYRAYQSIGADYFDVVARRFNPARLATQLVETAASMAPSLLDDVGQIRSQAVVYDSMCPWGRIVARQAGLPAVASMALMDLPPRYMLKSGSLWSVLSVMGRGLPWVPRYWRAAQAVRQATGVAVPSFVRLLNWPGDRNICYTAQLLEPQAHRHKANYTFVGPPIKEVPYDIPFPYGKLMADRSLVYVSLGTVFNNNPAFFRACLAAFAGNEVQVVLSTGRRLKPSDLAPLPDNAIVREYVPQQAILQRASLFISHSGANSVHQALVHGVPLLLVPQQLEQAMIAARITELGAGLLLNRGQVTSERIRQMALRLLGEETFRIRASVLGAALRESGGAERAADELQAVAGLAPVQQENRT
jgi:MGT family glycosyltransferase